jgi:hypothetical protein
LVTKVSSGDGRRRPERRRPIALVAAVTLIVAALVAVASPAGAHGGDVGVGAGASANGPLSASVDASATWLNDGDPASGLSMFVQGGGIGSVPMVETSEGQYHANVSFPAGGTYQLSISWSGNSSTPGGTGVSVTVQGSPPPTAPPVTAPPATSPPATAPPAGGGSITAPGAGATSTTTTLAPGDTSAPAGAPVPAAVPGGGTGAPVFVVPSAVPRGSYSLVSFAVPDASATLGVTAVTIEFPADTRVVGITVQALPGWTPTVEKREIAATGTTSTNVNQAVAKVTWTATAGGLAPDQFELFTFNAGPFPKQGKAVKFVVHETLTTGEIVTWDGTAALRLTTASASSSTSSFSH